MEYRIEKRAAFRVVGVSTAIDRDMEKNFQILPQLWGKAAMDGTVERLSGMMDGQPIGLLGICACADDAEWRYYIAVASSKTEADLEAYTVPAATWAIFPGSGAHQSIQELERRVLTEWLPGSGYAYGNAPDVEVYLNPDPENAKYEVWIPVVKKD